MEVKKAYDLWAEQYDTNKNRTRDLEGFALREVLKEKKFKSCLEIGCGTGKNTSWLLQKAQQVFAVDLSEEMLKKAKQKISSQKVKFLQADITERWDFVSGKFDLIVFSLVLEHIQDLDFIFKKAAETISENGMIYIGELHPFKQYSGTKARFEIPEGKQIVECYNHHISSFTTASKKYNFEIEDFQEYFDEDENSLPRIFTLLLKKS